jgi:RHS repeat-associated protein
MVYDVLGRLTQSYRPTSSTNSTLEYTNYGYQGRTSTVQDPKGYTTTKKSDVTGQPLRLIDPDGSSTTYYTYSPFGAIASIQDPAGNQTTRTYDSLGYLMTASADPDRGSWTYQYDSLGELINLRDAKTVSPNWTQQLTYDALGRPLTRVEIEGTTTWTWGTVAASHEIGRLKQLSGLGDTEANTFDAYGRPASHTQTWNSTNYVVGYAYNTLGKLDTLTYPSTPLSGNAFAVKYGYSNGYLSSLQNYTGGTAGTTFWQLTSGGVNMDPWGHVIDETLGTTTAVRIQSAFDAVTSWINTREVGSGGSGSNLQNLAYQWDLNGNLSQRQDLKQSLTEAFSYDNLNRLQSSTLNGTQNLSVTIDNTGNITQRVEGGVTFPYTYDTTHKHAVDTVGTGGNQTSYAYDANGNMSTRNGYSISWSTSNLPTTINGPSGVSATFSYGPDRQRKQQTAVYNAEGDSGSETTVYVAGLFEVETTPAQTHYKHFVQVPGGTQIIYDLQSVSGTQVTYVTADHLGSGNLLLNSSGTTLINENYSAYGYRRSSNWSGPLSTSSGDYSTISSTTRRGFTDAFHEMIDNLGLIHMNGRVYDPVIGRFLSADPLPGVVCQSQSWNPYSYVRNQPLRLTDPTGLADAPPDTIKSEGQTLAAPPGSEDNPTPQPDTNVTGNNWVPGGPRSSTTPSVTGGNPNPAAGTNGGGNGPQAKPPKQTCMETCMAGKVPGIAQAVKIGAGAGAGAAVGQVFGVGGGLFGAVLGASIAFGSSYLDGHSGSRIGGAAVDAGGNFEMSLLGGKSPFGALVGTAVGSAVPGDDPVGAFGSAILGNTAGAILDSIVNVALGVGTYASEFAALNSSNAYIAAGAAAAGVVAVTVAVGQCMGDCKGK